MKDLTKNHELFENQISDNECPDSDDIFSLLRRLQY